MGQTTPTNLRAHIWVGEAHFGHARARAHVPRAGLRHGLAQWLLEKLKLVTVVGWTHDRIRTRTRKS